MTSTIGGVVVVGLTLGALVLVLVLQNLRDDRALAARDDVMGPLLSQEIRSLAGFWIDAPVLSRRVRVSLDMTACPPPLVLDVLAHVPPLLPSWVRLRLLASFGAGVTVAFTAEAQRRQAAVGGWRGALPGSGVSPGHGGLASGNDGGGCRPLHTRPVEKRHESPAFASNWNAHRRE